MKDLYENTHPRRAIGDGILDMLNSSGEGHLRKNIFKFSLESPRYRPSSSSSIIDKVTSPTGKLFHHEISYEIKHLTRYEIITTHHSLRSQKGHIPQHRPNPNFPDIIKPVKADAQRLVVKHPSFGWQPQLRCLLSRLIRIL